MRIVHVMDTLAVFGGVNSFVYDLCKALVAIGENVTLIGVLERNKDDRIIEELHALGIEVLCLNALNKQDAILHKIPVLREYIKRRASNENVICNVHLKLSALMGTIATRGIKNVRCVETYHSQYSRYWFQQKIMSISIDKYICCSESAKKEFLRRFHPDNNKVLCIPNGIDSEGLNKSVEGLHSSNSIVTFLSVGRFTDQKNFHVAAKALSEISSLMAIYYLIGDGPLREKAKKEANNSATVKFLDPVPRSEIAKKIRQADMVIIPSLWEGLSIFMLEAMSLGCPLMLSDVESVRSVVSEEPLNTGESWRRCSWGYLVETNNTEAYYIAANDFISHPELKKRMSETIKMKSNKYSIRTTAHSYADMYYSLVEGA